MDFTIASLLGVAEDASFWSNALSVFWRVLLVVLGVNMLVIVHEFGHFIVARMCGVRCDKFYIWFDAYGFKFFSFKRGDTEYGLGWLPLGGYVKMLGQEDNPGGIQAEIDRAKLERSEKDSDLSEDEKNEQDEKIKSLENQLYAPDSYLAKNVFQRMAIISAGVIMNIIFAIICAACASAIGTPETSAKIGYVAPGSPAWRAGLEPGDEILSINDEKNPIFSSILVACMDGKELALNVARPGVAEPLAINVTPQVAKGALTPMIGVGPSPAIDLASEGVDRPYEAALDKAEEEKIVANLGALKGGERLVSMNGTSVECSADYLRLSKLYIDQPIEYVFAPTIRLRGGERVIDDSREKISVTLEPNRAPNLGVRLTMGEIREIIPGSPADKAGLRAREVDENGNVTRKGDVVLDVDNVPIEDPMTLPYSIFVKTGKETSSAANTSGGRRTFILTVEREGERVDVPIAAASGAPYSGFASSNGLLACGALGFAYEVKTIIAGVDGSALVGKSPLGGRIVEIQAMIPNPGPESSKAVAEVFKSVTNRKVTSLPAGELVPATCSVVNSKNSPEEDSATILTWFSTVAPYLPDGTDAIIKAVALDGETVEFKTKVKRDENACLTDRGLIFAVDVVHQRANSFGDAVKFGVDKTIESASQVFVFLRNVGKNVSAKALGGPGMIVGTAYQAAGRADGVFLLFLCLISANLAVVNFLPIPVLDGGHMVFLLYEAITRRKPNERVQIALSYIGFALILALMFWVIFLDIARYCF